MWNIAGDEIVGIFFLFWQSLRLEFAYLFICLLYKLRVLTLSTLFCKWKQAKFINFFFHWTHFVFYFRVLFRWLTIMLVNIFSMAFSRGGWELSVSFYSQKRESLIISNSSVRALYSWPTIFFMISQKYRVIFPTFLIKFEHVFVV